MSRIAHTNVLKFVAAKFNFLLGSYRLKMFENKINALFIGNVFTSKCNKLTAKISSHWEKQNDKHIPVAIYL